MAMGSRSHSALSSGGMAPFRTTHWTVVLSATRDGSAKAQASWEELCETYWFPLYAFIRKRGYDPHTAEDLTQSFFAFLIEKDALGKVERQKGKFRSFLIASAKNFLANDWNRAQTAKRGGRYSFVAWEEECAEERYQLEADLQFSAEMVFDRTWASVLLERVQTQLAEEFRIAGKEELFQTLRTKLLGDDAPAYVECAHKLQLSEGAIRMTVTRMRKRLRDILREEIARTVATPDEIEEEVRHFLTLISH